MKLSTNCNNAIMLKDILTAEALGQLESLIRASETIIICCHQNPDGDALGSTLAWAEVLRSQFGKEPQMIVPDLYPDFLQWMPNTDKIIRYDKHRQGCDFVLARADLIFCLDFNTPSRTADMEQALRQSTATKVLIDHHIGPDIDAAVTISHPEACSTCEIVFRIVWQLGAFDRLDKHFAIPIYCGMMTDTGGFTFASSRPEIFYIISLLLTKHINKDKIYRNVYHNYSEDRLRLMGYVMYQKLVYLPEYNAAYYVLTKEELQQFHFIKGDAEGLVNIPQQIKGLRLSISLREDTEKPNTVWVSLRSVDDFPCNQMAEKFFNGGGHLNASGGRLYCSIDEAVQTVKRAIEAYRELLQ